jgi:RimJ/RimL family protein N-acetyltransferase
MNFDGKFKEKFFLKDECVQMRILRVTDVQDYYLQWMRDPEVCRYSQWRFYTHSLQSLTSYAENAWKDPNVLFCAIALVAPNRHIGNIKMTADPHYRTAEISILIGEKDCWGKGYATAAIRLLADYALNVLGLRKIWGGAYSSNRGSIRAFEKAGFEIEARLKRHFLTLEGEVDGIFFARFAPAKGTDQSLAGISLRQSLTTAEVAP